MNPETSDLVEDYTSPRQAAINGCKTKYFTSFAIAVLSAGLIALIIFAIAKAKTLTPSMSHLAVGAISALVVIAVISAFVTSYYWNKADRLDAARH